MKTYSYSEARQNLANLLEEAGRSGEVRITRRDGRSFVVRPARSKRSPLDVAGLDLGVSTKEILSVIRESRRPR